MAADGLFTSVQHPDGSVDLFAKGVKVHVESDGTVTTTALVAAPLGVQIPYPETDGRLGVNQYIASPP
jgi:hypothetical protein